MSEKILKRVQQLMALSNNNSNVNEAAAAYKAAQKLLSENRLSMADVDAFSVEDEESVEDAEDGLYEGKRAVTWKGSLALGIARCNGCDVYWSNNGRRKKLSVVGRPADIEVVRWLYDSVARQIELFCKLEMSLGSGSGKTFSNNFKKGAVSSVVSRLQEAKREVETKYEGTSALVLVKQKDEDVAKFMAGLGLKKSKTYSRYDSSGYEAGRAAGRRINISKGGLNARGPKGELN